MHSESCQHGNVVRIISKLFGFTDHQRAIDEFESQKVGTRVNLLSLNV